MSPSRNGWKINFPSDADILPIPHLFLPVSTLAPFVGLRGFFPRSAANFALNP